jgi:hypothetical protein
MREGEVSEGADLLFKYEELLNFVENLKEATQTEFEDKLSTSMQNIVEAVEQADPQSRNNHEEGDTSVLFWPESGFEEADDEKTSRLAIGLYLSSMPLDEDSNVWITVRGHQKVLHRMRKAHDEKETWLQWMTQESKARKSAQFQWDFDWHREYESFEEMEKRLSKLIIEVLIGLRAIAGR